MDFGESLMKVSLMAMKTGFPAIDVELAPPQTIESGLCGNW